MMSPPGLLGDALPPGRMRPVRGSGPLLEWRGPSPRRFGRDELGPVLVQDESKVKERQTMTPTDLFCVKELWLFKLEF